MWRGLFFSKHKINKQTIVSISYFYFGYLLHLFVCIYIYMSNMCQHTTHRFRKNKSCSNVWLLCQYLYIIIIIIKITIRHCRSNFELTLDVFAFLLMYSQYNHFNEINSLKNESHRIKLYKLGTNSFMCLSWVIIKTTDLIYTQS